MGQKLLRGSLHYCYCCRSAAAVTPLSLSICSEEEVEEGGWFDRVTNHCCTICNLHSMKRIGPVNHTKRVQTLLTLLNSVALFFYPKIEAYLLYISSGICKPIVKLTER